MRLRAVFFDVGNTLLLPHPSVSEVCLEILESEGHVRDLSAIEDLIPLVEQYYEDRYREDDTFWTSEEESSQVWVGMYTLMCRRLGIEEKAEHIARRVYEEFGQAKRWRAYDDVVPALGRLRARGIATGVISNWDRRLSGILGGLGLSSMLDTVVSSAMVELHKPDPRIFELAAKRLSVEPHEAVHVGDHYYADVLGAKISGFTPVLIDRTGGEPANGVETIHSLDELDDLLA